MYKLYYGASLIFKTNVRRQLELFLRDQNDFTNMFVIHLDKRKVKVLDPKDFVKDT